MSTGEEPPHVSLPQYEGPLDLLLDLVRTHRLNILDLPVAEVTSLLHQLLAGVPFVLDPLELARDSLAG